VYIFVELELFFFFQVVVDFSYSFSYSSQSSSPSLPVRSVARLEDLRVPLKRRDGFEDSGSLRDIWETWRGSHCSVDDSLRPSGWLEAEPDVV
jgi:hypothetical protein